MTDAWDDMRRAKEESYFDKKNREALERIASKQSDAPRLSPVSGKPMEKVALHGIVIEKCPVSGGIWLDAGELEHLIRAAQGEAGAAPKKDFFGEFLDGLKGLVGK
jgi:Zn-finger nucleic acid-binding protein